MSSLLLEMELKAGTPGGMEQYRLTLCLSFFYKFFAAVKLELLKTKVSYYDLNLAIQDVDQFFTSVSFISE